ncbi:MAG: hypothetical protein OHK0017_08860 [Patescibacteria group bacterium]
MLVIALNKTLQIYLQNELNQVETVLFKQQESGYLQLHDEFEKIWKDILWSKINQLEDSKILLIVGQNATFTNSRVLFIWLNSLATFQPNKFQLAKHLENKIDFDQNPDELLTNLALLKHRVEWDQLLNSEIYSREPTINL